MQATITTKGEHTETTPCRLFVAAVALVVSATPAAADQKPTPNGLCGAKNMVHENSRDAMLTAMMEHTNYRGDAGMFAAVARTTCAP